MLAWPLRPPTVAWLGGMALAAMAINVLGALVSGLLGMVLEAAWWVMAFKLASEALSKVASGHEGEIGYEQQASDGNATWQLMLGIAVLGLGALCWYFGGTGARFAFCTVVVLALPAVIVLLVLEESVVAAFDPRNWLLVLRGLGKDYVVVAAQVAALAVAVGFGVALVSQSFPPWLGTGVTHGLALYFLFATYHALGVLLDRHRDALDGTNQAPARAARAPDLATPEERDAVREANDLLAADQPAAAAAVLDRLIRGRGATAPVHARYRALLERLGDADGLAQHARAYVATLLHLGQDREAIALYRSAREREPGFELVDPQALSDLIAAAARGQQSQLAVALAEEFARRFPRDRDLVLNGLTAARLMDRLGRDAEAAVLLRRLLAAQPDHALVPELEAALQALSLPN
jgi:tetratricopeptide (TPR) repeat protein